MSELTHFNEHGSAHMVDVSEKAITHRVAVAEARIIALPETIRKIADGSASKKGDVLQIARIAGIMATKRTADLIPLCHPLPIEKASIDFELESDSTIQITATVSVTAKTGVEMEALTAATVSALTIYDMCKAIDRSMEVTDVRLVEKSGGRSGDFRQDSAETDA